VKSSSANGDAPTAATGEASFRNPTELGSMRRSLVKKAPYYQGANEILSRIGIEGVESALRVLWPRRHGSAGSKRDTRTLIRVDLAALRIARKGAA
jgi:hypothetical protein